MRLEKYEFKLEHHESVSIVVRAHFYCPIYGMLFTGGDIVFSHHFVYSKPQ